jgi:nucleoside-diphosphate-sugar epimerase
MNILLTGYSSKIGEELYKSLHELKHEIFFLGRKPIANYPESNWTSWALGTKPDLSNLPSIDVLIHIAWITRSRRSNFHLNIGGTIQLFEEIKVRNSKIVFLSSLSAINPKSFYGLSKKKIENLYENKQLEILRPGLVLGAEKYTSRINKFRIIPGRKTNVYITHLECLINEFLRTIQNPKKTDGNLICQTITLSKLISKNSWFFPLPLFIFQKILDLLPASEWASDLKDSFTSLVSTPNLEVDSCCCKDEKLTAETI